MRDQFALTIKVLSANGTALQLFDMSAQLIGLLQVLLIAKHIQIVLEDVDGLV